MSQDTSKKFKKGDKLLIEGAPGNSVFFIQTGKVKVFLERSGKTLEVATLGPQQVIGDQWLFSQSKSLFSFEAMQECQVLELPVEVLKVNYDKTNPILKMIVKSMADELKVLRQGQKSRLLEGDFSPMPLIQMPKSLSLIHMTARHIGRSKEDGTELEVDWGLLRQFLQKFFMEPGSRLKQWMMLFKKKGLCRFEIKTTEDGEEDLGKIVFSDIQRLENFAEFYQHYYFKNPTHELIQYEDGPFKAAKILVDVGADAPVDHRKATVVDMTALNEAYKKSYGVEFKTNLFDHLERKGLFVKRQSYDDGRLTVAFDREEYSRVVGFWELLREVNLWNEKGFVDMEEKLQTQEGGAKLACPSCHGELQTEHRFCPQCGFKLAA